MVVPDLAPVPDGPAEAVDGVAPVEPSEPVELVLAVDDAGSASGYRDRAMSLLQARGITKSFGSRLILDGLDFDIEPGVRMGVIGPNGGGKSTLLRIFAGEEEADAGESRAAD